MGEAALAVAHVEFIQASSLLFVLSGRPGAVPDISPRGDAPGFVRVVDQDRLLLPDRIGNNRLDSLQNLLVDPRVALVFLRTGDPRALKVSGTARILGTASLLAAFAINGRPPRSVMEVSVTAAHLAATAAIAAADLWHPYDDGKLPAVASLGEILSDQVGGMSKAQGEAWIANSYTNKLY